MTTTFRASRAVPRFVVAASGYSHANLKRRWDASVLTGYTDGAAIHPWSDEIAAGLMSQANAANRPTYKTGIRNGLAVARFDTTDWMQSAAVATTQTTIAITRKLVTTSGSIVQAYHGDTSHGGGMAVVSGNKTAYVRVISVDQDSAATTNWERWILCMSSAGGAGATRLYVNGTLVVNTSSAMIALTGTAACRLGASDGANETSGTPNQLSGGMDLGEALFFDASLNSTDVGTLDTYLASKWG